MCLEDSNFEPILGDSKWYNMASSDLNNYIQCPRYQDKTNGKLGECIP